MLQWNCITKVILYDWNLKIKYNELRFNQYLVTYFSTSTHTNTHIISHLSTLSNTHIFLTNSTQLAASMAYLNKH